MSIDQLLTEFESFTDRARAVLAAHIADALAAATVTDNKKSSAQNLLTDLQGQISAAQTQLDSIHAHLAKATELAAVESEVASARKTLDALQAENKALEVANAGLAKQRTEREAQVAVLDNEARRLVSLRSEGEQVMRELRMKLHQIPIGVQS